MSVDDRLIVFLVSFLVAFPLASGLLGLVLVKAVVRRFLVLLTSVALVVATAFCLRTVLRDGTVAFSPSDQWSTLIMVFHLGVLAYFLYVGIRRRHVLVTGLAVAQCLLFIWLQYAVIPPGYEVQNVFRIDLLSMIMGLVICVVGSLVILYALDYMPHHEKHLGLSHTRQPVFFLYLIGLLGAMNGLVFSNSLLWLLFFWELTTLCCYQLIGHDGTKAAQSSALQALWMNLLGAVAFVLGAILTFQAVGTLDMDEIIRSSMVGSALLVPLALFCLTGFTKAAQVPWQAWLLGAMVAPTPVSALLHSSTMVKAGVYLVLRMAPGYEGTILSAAVAVFGAFVFMATSLLAISERSSKRVLAYSTISNLGLIICCAGINTDLAIAAAIALIIFHAVSKGMLFLAVGVIEQQINSRDIEDMEGLITRLPVVTGAAVVGMLTMLFMPFGVVFAKWVGLEAAAAPVSPWFPVVVCFMALGSAASLVFWSKWIGRFLSSLDIDKASHPASGGERRSFFGYGTVLMLVGGALVLSVVIVPLINVLIAPAEQAMGYGAAFDTSGWLLKSAYGTFNPWLLFVAVVVAIGLPMFLIRVRGDELQPAYLCGVNVAKNPRVFRAVSDGPVATVTGGTYWQSIFGERRLNSWVNCTGLLLLVALFVGVMISNG